jgi:hypothetical protein
MLGCVLLAVTPALSACGGGGQATAPAKAAATAPAQRARPTAADGRCQIEVGGFLKSMTALRGNLAVGLSYEQYAAEMYGVRVAYDDVPVEKLTIACLSTVGTPAEKALNEYVAAANIWGECLAESGCDTASIESSLQRKWRVASHYLSEARPAP